MVIWLEKDVEFHQTGFNQQKHGVLHQETRAISDCDLTGRKIQGINRNVNEKNPIVTNSVTSWCPQDS